MIIDAHNSVVPWDSNSFEQLYGPMVDLFQPCSYENILGQMDKLGIDRLITWNVAVRPELSSLCNDWTAKVRDRNPDRFIGFCSVHPSAPDEALMEIERSVSRLGLVGLKLHPLVQKISMSDAKVLQLVRKAMTMELPVVLHVNPPVFEEFKMLTDDTPDGRGKIDFTREDFTDAKRSSFCNPSHLESVVETYNSPKVMSAHMGGLFLREVWDSNISFHTAGASKKAIEWACKYLGAERVIFGTDFPFYKMEDEFNKVETADISMDDRKKLFSENILKILEK